MTYYKMAHAKTHLAGLIREALAGREVVIARDDQPLVRLVPVQPDPTDHARTAGDLQGRVTLPDAFFDPLSDDQLADWEL